MDIVYTRIKTVDARLICNESKKKFLIFSVVTKFKKVEIVLYETQKGRCWFDMHQMQKD